MCAAIRPTATRPPPPHRAHRHGRLNLYAFEKAAANPDARFAEIIENIDIGGSRPHPLRGQNFEDVAVVTRRPTNTAPGRRAGPSTAASSAARPAGASPRRPSPPPASYDTAIANALERMEPSMPGQPLRFNDHFPETSASPTPSFQSLRYGENPHQPRGALSRRLRRRHRRGPPAQGKELSYTTSSTSTPAGISSRNSKSPPSPSSSTPIPARGHRVTC